MTRFRAINEASSSDSDDDSEEKETKEAQEERAFAQYNQGLRLQSEKKYGEAEQIFFSLLGSPFLDQVSGSCADGPDTLVRPAAALKYGCLKNLGEVLVKRGSIKEGLDCYLQALELDNSDVTLWHRAGQMALQVNRLDLASCAFQQALQCNPGYWPSLDALLPVLYALGDTMGCLVLCCRTLRLDRAYPLARAFRARILKERPSLTVDLAALNMDDWDLKVENDDYSEELVKIATDLQTLWRQVENATLEPQLSANDDRCLTANVSSATWIAVGKALLQQYRRISNSDPPVSFLNPVKLELAESALNSKGATPPAITDGAGESDSDCDDQTEEDVTEASGQEQEDATKASTRKRRRGSMSLLDPYKRRSMRVRNGVRREQEREDTSLADALRSLLPPSLHITNIEMESESEKRRRDVRRLTDAVAWGDDSDDAAVELCRLLEQRETESGQSRPHQNRRDFLARKLKEEGYFGTERETKDVQEFLDSHDENHIILDLLSSFLHRLSAMNAVVWPSGLARIYIDAYQYYRCHIHHPSPYCSSVSPEDLQKDAELSVLYGELSQDRVMRNDRQSAKTPSGAASHILEEGLSQLSMLLGRPDTLCSPAGRNLFLRGLWVRVRYSLHHDDSSSAISTLKDIIYFLDNCLEEEDLRKEGALQAEREASAENVAQLSQDAVCLAEPGTEKTDRSPISKSEPMVVDSEPNKDVVITVQSDCDKEESDHVGGTAIEENREELATDIINVKKEQSGDQVSVQAQQSCPNESASAKIGSDSAELKPNDESAANKFREQTDSVTTHEEFSLVIPNCKNYCVINKQTVQRLLTSLTRKQQLKRMEYLYENGLFSDLVDMLADCFKFCAQQVDNASDSDDFDDLPDRPTQMAMLLDALWQLERYNDCVFWAEACLHEAHGRYLNGAEEAREQQVWATVVENILVGMDRCLALSPVQPLEKLPPARLSRLVQTTSGLLCHQLDQQDGTDVAVECTTAWLLLYRVVKFEELHLKTSPVETAALPHSLLVLFTAHDYMAKRGWCCQGEGRLLLAIIEGVLIHLRRPALYSYREEMAHQAEQAIFCLFKHPQKAKEQGRKRYLQDHKVPSQLTLTWERAMQLLEFVRPDELPQMDSLADASIDADCEVLLKRIGELIPQDCIPQIALEELKAFIDGKTKTLPSSHFQLPVRADDLFYLLADYYFKSRNFDLAIRYYMLDICANPNRFDSWAAMGLARSTKLTTKLNSCDRLGVEKMLAKILEAQRCFLRALELNGNNNIIIIEFGSFAYCMHSFCSRLLKADPNDRNVDMFEEMLAQASKCFTTARQVVQDERWLHEYMLGKIAEKRGEGPAMFLRHYQMAAFLLDESGAEYPQILDYDSKRRLAFEAHEVHYRIHASILKQLLQSSYRPIDSTTYELYRCCLVKMAEGPFMKAAKHPIPPGSELLEVRGSFQPSANSGAAKVLQRTKRKSSEKSREGNASKKMKTESNAGVAGPAPTTATETQVAQPTETVDGSKQTEQATQQTPKEGEVKKEKEGTSSGNATSSSASSSSDSSGESGSSSGDSSDSSDESSDSSSSDSEDSSGSSSTEDDKNACEKTDSEKQEAAKAGKQAESTLAEKGKRSPQTQTLHEVGPLVRACLVAMEECLLRYPRHYKSLYRLAHYYYSRGEHRNLDKCWQLLLGKYHIERADRHINGLFKSDHFRNMFSDMWRIPSEEVDRAGSFAAHMSRCVLLVLQLLRDKRDHHRLIQLSVYLHRDPENARSKYLRDNERKELAQQAVEMCSMVLRNAVPETNSIDALLEVYGTVHMAINVIQDLPRSTLETFRVFLTDAYKTFKDLKSTNYDAAVDFCKREKAQRKKQAALAEAAHQASLQASLPLQIPPSGANTSVPLGTSTTSASQYLPTVTISKVPTNPLTPVPQRFPAPTASWPGLPHAHAQTPATGKVGRPPKKASWPAQGMGVAARQPVPSASPNYGPGRMSVEQLLLSMGMMNDLPYQPPMQQGMNYLAQMPPQQSRQQQQQPRAKQAQPKAAPTVASMVNNRPGISITPLQAGTQRKPFNVPSKSQLIVEPVAPQPPSVPQPQPQSQPQPSWPGAPRGPGRPPQHVTRPGISVVPTSRLLKPTASSGATDASLAALSRLREHSHLQVTPRPRGRPPNPLSAGRGRSRLSAPPPPPTPWPGMPMPMNMGATNAIRPVVRPPSPRSHATAIALARAQALQELEQVRAKQQHQFLQQIQQNDPMRRQQSSQVARPAVRLPSGSASLITVNSSAPAPSTAAGAAAAAAVFDPEIITLE